MALLHRGVDLTVIALWLGHESTETTQIYLHADMQLKERALAHATSSGLTPDRFRPPDPLLAFLESLWLCRLTEPRKSENLRKEYDLTTPTRHNPGVGITFANGL
jgi:hypothetical protein